MCGWRRRKEKNVETRLIAQGEAHLNGEGEIRTKAMGTGCAFQQVAHASVGCGSAGLRLILRWGSALVHFR